MSCCGNQKTEDQKPSQGQKGKNDSTIFKPVKSKSRSCTDIFCCIIFLVSTIIFFLISVFGIINGEPEILFAPTDSEGNLCGYGNYTDKPNLLFFDITECLSSSIISEQQCTTRQICVEHCPDDYSSGFYLIELEKLQPDQIYVNSSTVYCREGINDQIIDEYRKNDKLEELFTYEICAAYTLPSTNILKRCIPSISFNSQEDYNTTITFTSKVTNEIVEIYDHSGQDTITFGILTEALSGLGKILDTEGYLSQALSELNDIWWICLLLVILAGIISLLWVILLRFFLKPMVFVTLSALVGVIGFGIYYCYDTYIDMGDSSNDDQIESFTDIGFTTDLSAYLRVRDTWLVFLILASVSEIILLLMIIFLYQRVKIAIEIMSEASKALSSMWSALFYPVVTWLLFILPLICFYIYSTLALVSVSVPTYRVYSTLPENSLVNATFVGESCDPNSFIPETPDQECIFIDYNDDSVIVHEYLTYFCVLTFIIFIWISNFFLAQGEMTLAGAFSSWYWTWTFKKKGKKDLENLPILNSFGRSLWFHTGTLAFGSSIITIIQIIRYIFEYIDAKLKANQAMQNWLVKSISCCCKCCLACFERFLRYVNRNAYIITASNSKAFCPAAYEAFNLIVSNILRVTVLDKTTDFILFVGKFLVMFSISGISWAIFSNSTAISNTLGIDVPDIDDYWLIVCVISLVSYFIASGFFAVYGMAVDTVFMCFLLDIEHNDGSKEKPYYMSKGLKKILGKKNYF